MGIYCLTFCARRRCTRMSGLDLLYRASDNGYDVASFHTKCDNKQTLSTLIETEHEYIFGGYLSVGYQDNNRFAEDEKAFLFSICDPPTIYIIDKWDTVSACWYQIYKWIRTKIMYSMWSLCLCVLC
eukprot:164370_1